MMRKENTNGSHVYVVLYIKNSVSWLYYENLKFQIFDVAFLILLSVFLAFENPNISGIVGLDEATWNR